MMIARQNVCLNAAIYYLPTCEIDVELTTALRLRWRMRNIDFELAGAVLANHTVRALKEGAEVVTQGRMADVNVQSRRRASR
jgi:hypothetical protein